MPAVILFTKGLGIPSRLNIVCFMNLQIESPRFEPAEKLLQMVEDRFFHLSKMYDRIIHCDVILRKEKSSGQRCCWVEAKMEVPGAMLFATEKEEHFESALKNVIEDLEHQLRKLKEERSEK